MRAPRSWRHQKASGVSSVRPSAPWAWSARSSTACRTPATWNLMRETSSRALSEGEGGGGAEGESETEPVPEVEREAEGEPEESEVEREAEGEPESEVESAPERRQAVRSTSRRAASISARLSAIQPCT